MERASRSCSMMRLSSLHLGACLLSNRGLSAKVHPCCRRRRSFLDNKKRLRGWSLGPLHVLYAKSRATYSYSCPALGGFVAYSPCSSPLDSNLPCVCCPCSVSCLVTIRTLRSGPPRPASAKSSWQPTSPRRA